MNIDLDIRGRVGNCCPGFVCKPGDLGSPPDIESNISPIEFKSNGKIVVDGSIPHPSIGLLRENVMLKIENGCIKSIKASTFLKKNKLNFQFCTSEKVKNSCRMWE